MVTVVIRAQWEHIDIIAWLALSTTSQDHPGMFKEQWALYDNGFYPGYVFNPDFQDGWSTFFDITLCCIYHSVSSSTSCAEFGSFGWVQFYSLGRTLFATSYCCIILEKPFATTVHPVANE